MKRTLTLLVLALACFSARAQDNNLPQVFSPNAAELGKYGKIPVSYFNGLPNISIPLTELRAKNYTLPVYLTYHAGGNKPEQHPGWVGLGWTLHAGGCINRIVNELKDEMDDVEFGSVLDQYSTSMPGYIYNVDSLYPLDPDAQLNAMPKYSIVDLSPDEFQVNLEGIQASFYFVGANDIRIVSKGDADFKVEYEIAYAAATKHNFNPYSSFFRWYLFSYFRQFIITDKDGIKYYFGGDDNAIEFSASQCLPISEDKNLIYNGYCFSVATANTWMLKKIVCPDGEEIVFEYERHGAPTLLMDSHYAIDIYDDDFKQIEYRDTRDSTKVENMNYPNVSYCFLLPTYLSSIHCKYSSDEITFHCSPSRELECNLEPSKFYSKTNMSLERLNLPEQNIYMQLDSIASLHGGACLEYTSDFGTRLKMKSVSLFGLSGQVGKYAMTYDSESLPAYNSRKTDMWGFYLGPDAYNPYSPTLEQDRRQIQEKYQRAEILTKLTYPTGGWTEFEYERNAYDSLATQFPFKVTPESGYAGGLRIKTMKDITAGEDVNERHFEYKSSTGKSSGILSGTPRCYVEGNYSSEYNSFFRINRERRGRYWYFSERVFNQLSTTNGRHVTYGRVTESFPDSSKTVYEYSNHGSPSARDREPTILQNCLSDYLIDNPFNSMELSRGLLNVRTDYNNMGNVIRKEENRYAQDTTQFIKDRRGVYLDSNGLFLAREAIVKIYSYFPSLQKRVVTTYPDDGGTPLVETEEYTYNAHRQLTGTKRTVGADSTRTAVSYSGDMDSTGVYGRMRAAYVLDRPVEQTEYRDGKVVSSRLTTYKELSGGVFVPDVVRLAELDSPVEASSWQPYRGTAWGIATRHPRLAMSFPEYDAQGNLLCAEGADGVRNRYVWTPDGLFPAASFAGLARDVVRNEGAVYQGMSEDRRTSPAYHADFAFDTDIAGEVRVDVNYTPGGGHDLYFLLDGETEAVYTFTGSNDPPLPLPVTRAALFEGISPGRHTLRVAATEEWLYKDEGGLLEPADSAIARPRPAGVSPDDPDLPSGGGEGATVQWPGMVYCDISVGYPRKEVWYTLSGDAPVLYRDFEDGEGLSIRTGGFHSGRSWGGPYHVTLQIPSGRPYTVDWMELSGEKWRYRKAAYTGPAAVGTGAEAVDNVRVYPDGADVRTWTWWPTGDLRSATDGKGVTESYGYDGLGRLTEVRDTEGNPVAGYQYEYKNR